MSRSQVYLQPYFPGELNMSCRFEYLALFASLILVLLETIIHLITFCLREWICSQCLYQCKLLTRIQQRRLSVSATNNQSRFSTSLSPRSLEKSERRRKSSRPRSQRRRILSRYARFSGMKQRSTSSKPEMVIFLDYTDWHTGRVKRACE